MNTLSILKRVFISCRVEKRILRGFYRQYPETHLLVMTGQAECAASVIYPQQPCTIVHFVVHIVAGCAFQIITKQQVGFDRTAQRCISNGGIV